MELTDKIGIHRITHTLVVNLKWYPPTFFHPKTKHEPLFLWRWWFGDWCSGDGVGVDGCEVLVMVVKVGWWVVW